MPLYELLTTERVNNQEPVPPTSYSRHVNGVKQSFYLHKAGYLERVEDASCRPR